MGDAPGGRGVEALGGDLGKRGELIRGQVLEFAALEHRPAQVVGQGLLLPLKLAHVVHRTGEDLDDVEPVDRDGGTRQMLGDPLEEGRRHIADHLEDLAGLAPVLTQERGELAQRVLATSRSNEQHRFPPPCHIDEHGHVVLPALTGGLVQPDAAHRAQVEARNGLAHVVLHDAPQAGIGDAHQADSGQPRHLPDEGQCGLLEQQREGAALARPWHFTRGTDAVM